MKFLIADDEQAHQVALQRLLRSHGDCVTATDGAQAVTLFRQALEAGEPFNAVFLDIRMPSMDGQEALTAIRKLEKERYGLSIDNRDYAVIIMATSLDDPQSVTEAFLKGKCNGYINKPVTRELVEEKLRHHNLI
ncbi:MAG: response regulator [Magnetococcales bacterium]|nr:response regulator [Magnetococcales bacterium]